MPHRPQLCRPRRTASAGANICTQTAPTRANLHARQFHTLTSYTAASLGLAPPVVMRVPAGFTRMLWMPHMPKGLDCKGPRARCVPSGAATGTTSCEDPDCSRWTSILGTEVSHPISHHGIHVTCRPCQCTRAKHLGDSIVQVDRTRRRPATNPQAIIDD